MRSSSGDSFLAQVFCSPSPEYILKLTEDNENRQFHSVENKTPLCMCAVWVGMKPRASHMLLRMAYRPQLPQAQHKTYYFLCVDCPNIHRVETGSQGTSSPRPKDRDKVG